MLRIMTTALISASMLLGTAGLASADPGNPPPQKSGQEAKAAMQKLRADLHRDLAALKQECKKPEGTAPTDAQKAKLAACHQKAKDLRADFRTKAKALHDQHADRKDHKKVEKGDKKDKKENTGKPGTRNHKDQRPAPKVTPAAPAVRP